MSKTVLMVVGVVLVLLGLAAMVSSWTWSAVPVWYRWAEIVVGVVAVYVSMTDKK